MKRLIIGLFIMVGINSAQAQFGIGIRGGLNFSSFPQNTYEVDNLEIETLPDSYTGWHVGGIAQIRITNFFIQPELLFVSTGNHLRLREPGEPDFFFRQNFSKIDLPVVMGFKIGPLRLGAGPVGSYIINSSSGLVKSEDHQGLDIREKFNSATFGYQIGAGLDLGNILLDFKYEGSLSRLGDGITFGDTTFPFDARPRQFILSIGLLF
jgi:hypothetical protein